MLARAFERGVAPQLPVDTAAVTGAVLDLLGEHETRGTRRALTPPR
jgi:hypothetical protein